MFKILLDILLIPVALLRFTLLSNFNLLEGSTFFKWKLKSFMDKKCSGLMLFHRLKSFEATFGPIAQDVSVVLFLWVSDSHTRVSF